MEFWLPRIDGYCAVCKKRKAVTRDNLLCKICLKKRIQHENPIDGEFRRRWHKRNGEIVYDNPDDDEGFGDISYFF